MGLEQGDIHMQQQQKNLYTDHIPVTKINSNWVTDLNTNV